MYAKNTKVVLTKGTSGQGVDSKSERLQLRFNAPLETTLWY